MEAYKEGRKFRYVGQAQVSGNIRVSGWHQRGSNYLSLSGSGYVSGSVFIREETKPVQARK